jgi:hypothetical protein
MLAVLHWPRPEHLDRLTPDEFDAFVNATGFDAAIKASVAELHPANSGD